MFHSFEARLFLAIWVIYVLHVVPGGGVNPNRYFDLIHSLVDQHSITIDAYHENTIDKAFKDGHFYSAGLPGPSLIGIPAYLAFKPMYQVLPTVALKLLANIQSLKQGTEGGFYQRDNSNFFLSTLWITWLSLSLLSALAAVGLFRVLLSLKISQGNAFLTTIAYAFGTPVFFYSTTYFSHVFGAAFVIFSLVVLVGLKSLKQTMAFMLLGILAGTALLMEYETLVLIGVLGLYVLYRWKPNGLIFFCLGALMPIMILFAYNTLAFGGPFHTPHQFLVGPNRLNHTVGILGFTVPRPEKLFGLLLSPARGLFLYSPWLLLAFVGWFVALRLKKRPMIDFALMGILASTALWIWISSFTDWKGGAAFGPRYLITSFPLMSVAVAFALSRVPKFISISLVAVSVANNWLGAQFGFAANLWEPWRKFLTSGFVLPVVSAITSHSTSDNPLTKSLNNWMWLITVVYGLLIVGCAVLISFGLRKRTKLGLSMPSSLEGTV